MKQKIFLLLVIRMAAPLSAADTGTTAANFLKLGIGPRAIAMGEAQVGLADDVYASYWNPAGLAPLRVPEAGFVQNQYLEDISEQYIAYADPRTPVGTLAGSFTYFNVGKFQGYDAAGQPNRSVDSSDLSFAVSQAATYFGDKRLGSGASIGLTGKYLQERLDTVTAKAYAADVGLLLVPGRRWGDTLDGWKAGLVLRNLGTSMKFDQESFNLPRSADAGISYTGHWRDEVLTITFDGRMPQAGPHSFGTGLELKTLQFLLLRAGYTSEGDLGNGVRFGAGLRFQTVQVDYAYAGAGELGSIHRIGLTLRFGKMPEDPIFAAQRWYEKGLADYNRKRFTEALVEFNKALEIDPSHPEALKMMKKTYEEIKTMVPE
jgi:tetratricopeptide (TPR) repeat protein